MESTRSTQPPISVYRTPSIGESTNGATSKEAEDNSSKMRKKSERSGEEPTCSRQHMILIYAIVQVEFAREYAASLALERAMGA